MKEFLQHCWHEVYYFCTGKYGSGLAMHCKEVTERIDLQGNHLSFFKNFRVYLHLSLCKACSNYFKISLALRNAMQRAFKKADKNSQLERLNEELVKKHSR